MISNRQKKYTKRDYEDLKDELMNLSKQYFPNFFNDFSEYTMEAMLMEMVAYVGDNLNFYIDDRYKQQFLQHADDLESMYRISKSKGYKPLTVSIAYGTVELSQNVPSTIVDNEYVPDEDFMGLIRKNSVFSDVSKNNYYTVLEDTNMRNYESIEVLEESGSNPSLYRITKDIRVRSGELKEKRLVVEDVEQYKTLSLDSDVAFVESVIDSDGNTWHEVDFLAQDTIFDEVNLNNITNDDFNTRETPYLLIPRRVNRRFVVDHTFDGKCKLKFGSGIDNIQNDLQSLSTEDLLTTNSLSQLQLASNYSIENFLKNDSFGVVPYDTTLNVRYIKGSGEEENTNPNTVTNIVDLITDFPTQVDDTIIESFIVNNEDPIIGASFLNSLEKIRNESYEAFYSQKRCVTEKDFILRTKLIPTKYGSFSKVFVEKDYVSNTSSESENQRKKDFKSINIHVLSKNTDSHLIRSNTYAKQNLKNYLKAFKMVSDSINILDAFIINIGIKFNFTPQFNNNSDLVLLKISERVEDFFNIDNWELNQPIDIEQLKMEMMKAEGVSSISDINIINKYDQSLGYSPIKYDCTVGGSNYDRSRGILLPPADVGIFELKYPEKDIEGRNV